MATSPRVAFLASLPVLEWGEFIAGADPCRKRALVSPHLTAADWAILRPLFLLAIERGAAGRSLERAIAAAFDVAASSAFVRTCMEESRLAVRIGIALERSRVFLNNATAARLLPFAQWRCSIDSERCPHAALGGRVIPSGSSLLRSYFPPLSETCFCTLAPVSAPRARREAAGFVFLLEEEVRHLVAPLWGGAPLPQLASEATCREVLTQGEAILSGLGIIWR